MGKGKDEKKYSQAQIMALKSTLRTDLSRATVGKPTVDPSKGRAPKYQNNQKAFDALNMAGRFAAESVALGAAGKAIGALGKAAYKGTYALGPKVVHGSPTQGLKSITPRTGSVARPDQRVNFSWNVKEFGANRGNVAQYASEYAGKDGAKGSFYVGKVKRSDIIQRGDGVVVSKGPIKVTKEIKQTADALKDSKALSQALKTPKTELAKAKNKVTNLKKQKQWEKEQSRSNKNSVA